MLKIILRVFLSIVGTIVVALAASTAWHSYADAQSIRLHPAPGQLVDVGGGRRLHILCKGTAAGPTIVLEAGLGDISANLWPLQDAIATFARVCTYDRAGSAWSDAAPAGRTMDEVARDLHTLLEDAGVPPPYVLAAHSLGGFYARLFARDFAGEVVGLVLIDSSEEGFNLSPEGMGAEPGIAATMTIGAWAARLGVLPILLAAMGSPATTLPPDAAAVDMRPAQLSAAADEIRATELLPDSMRVAGGFGTLGTLPLIAIAHDPDQPAETAFREADWTAAQKRLAALSSNSQLIVAIPSSHHVYLDQPTLVVDAIRRVYMAARGGGPLAAQ